MPGPLFIGGGIPPAATEDYCKTLTFALPDFERYYLLAYDGSTGPKNFIWIDDGCPEENDGSGTAGSSFPKGRANFPKERDRGVFSHVEFFY